MGTPTTAATALQQIEQEVGGIGTVATQVLPGSAAQVARVTGYTELGLATLPLFGQLFTLIGTLFHHAAAQATTPTPAPTNNAGGIPPPPVTTPVTQ